MFQYGKLKGRIVEIFGSQKKFAEAMGLSERTVSLKLQGATPWTQPEMFRAVGLLKEPVRMIDEYFFTQKVQ